jgi:hypothetical protein
MLDETSGAWVVRYMITVLSCDVNLVGSKFVTRPHFGGVDELSVMAPVHSAWDKQFEKHSIGLVVDTVYGEPVI